jgi:arginine deiminase
MSSITYETTAAALTAAEANLMSAEYKRKAVEQLDTFDLVDAIITRPTLTLEKSTHNTPLTSTAYNFAPLTNLVFTRDQQVVTAAGVVLSQLHSKQRNPEVHLIRFCLEKLGIPILGQIPAPGKLEGGDFIPAGRELCFIGLGIRTNARAITYMLRRQWFGTERVAVVKDLLDRKQARMHLDCVFNIVADDVVVLMDSIAGEHAEAFRLVDEYTLVDGQYHRTQENVEFLRYLRSVGFNVIRVTDRMQTNYGCNFINCGNSRLITTDAETADHIARSPHFRGTIDNVDFSEITKLYGALHCSTQVFRQRRPDRAPLSRPAPHPLTLVKELQMSASLALPPVRQTTNAVLVVAPTYFAQNPETFQDNAFMQSKAAQTMTTLEIVEQACTAFSKLYTALKANGIHVRLNHHESYHETPDAVFPNNWFSTHADCQTLVLYPMKHPSRQRERRESIVEFLRAQYPTVVDLTAHESDEDAAETLALEGTGALVLDRVNKVAFCAISPRANEHVLDEWGRRMGYQIVPFHTTNTIYHTNVMLSIGTSFALVCVECIVPEHRARVVGELKKCNKTVIRATEAQLKAFLCNCLELRTDQGERALFMSDQAHNSLTENQMYYLLQHVDKIVKVDFGIIERVAGGGVRCALAELF